MTSNYQKLLQANKRGLNFIKANVVVSYAFGKALSGNKLQYLHTSTYDRLFFTPALKMLLKDSTETQPIVQQLNDDFKRKPSSEAILGLRTFVERYENFLEDRFYITSLLTFDNPPRELFLEAVFAIAEVLQNDPDMKLWINDLEDTQITEQDYLYMMYFLGQEAVTPRDATLKARPSSLLTRTMTQSTMSGFLIASSTSVVHNDSSYTNNQQFPESMKSEEHDDVFKHSMEITKQEKKIEISAHLFIIASAFFGFGNISSFEKSYSLFLSPIIALLIFFVSSFVFNKTRGKMPIIVNSILYMTCQIIGFIGQQTNNYYVQSVYNAISLVIIPLILFSILEISFSSLGASQVYYIELSGIFYLSIVVKQHLRQYQSIIQYISMVTLILGTMLLLSISESNNLPQLQQDYSKSKKIKQLYQTEKLAASSNNLYNKIEQNLQLPCYQEQTFQITILSIFKNSKAITAMLIFFGLSIGFYPAKLEIEVLNQIDWNYLGFVLSIAVTILVSLICSFKIKAHKICQTVMMILSIAISIMIIVCSILSYSEILQNLMNLNSLLVVISVISSIIPQLAGVTEITARYQIIIVHLAIGLVSKTINDTISFWVSLHINCVIRSVSALLYSSLFIYLQWKKEQNNLIV